MACFYEILFINCNVLTPISPSVDNNEDDRISQDYFHTAWVVKKREKKRKRKCSVVLNSYKTTEQVFNCWKDLCLIFCSFQISVKKCQTTIAIKITVKIKISNTSRSLNYFNITRFFERTKLIYLLGFKNLLSIL